MKTIHDLIQTLPQKGRLELIQIRPARRGPITSVTEVSVDIESGLEGDHYSKPGGKRMVTLIQKEHLETIGEWFHLPEVAPLVRRNLVVSGINLLALHNQEFSIGNVVFQGTGHCPPCSRMEENLGLGGYNAMRGHGGITAKIIQGGHIRIGDQLISRKLSQVPDSD